MTSYTGSITSQIKKRVYDGQNRLPKVINITLIVVVKVPGCPLCKGIITFEYLNN